MGLDLTRYASGLRELEPGRWIADEGEVSYPASGHSSCYAVEDDSFWFRHRNECILAMVTRKPPSGPIFDIGGGNGVVSEALNDNGHEAVLIEPGEVGCANARARGLQVIARATAQAAGFRVGSLPAVGLFDVLEHIEDDRQFLVWLLDRLAPEARLYLTVPAFQALWSYEDVHAGHFRRYRHNEVVGLLTDSGFRIEYSSYIFMPLVPPIAILRSLPSRLGLREGVSDDTTRADHAPKGQSLLSRMLAPEPKRIDRGVAAAFIGTSVIACASKPEF